MRTTMAASTLRVTAQALFLLLLTITMSSSFAAATADSELTTLVQRHAEAQHGFDQATLKSITADNYVEISPVGEVDSREKMLSFYDPSQRRPAPTLQMDEITVRNFAQTAVVIARLTYTMSAEGQSRSFALRATYVAHQQDGKWLLVSAQYTGIRPPKG